jgi:hypothetical protein
MATTGGVSVESCTSACYTAGYVRGPSMLIYASSHCVYVMQPLAGMEVRSESLLSKMLTDSSTS